MLKKKFLIFFCLLFISLLGSAGWFLWYQSHPPYLTVMGNIYMADGLGRQTVELVQAIQNRVSVECIPTQIRDWSDVPKQVRKAISPYSKLQRFGKVIICENSLKNCCKKLKTPKNPEQLRIVYAMVESTQADRLGVALINQYFDLLAVPDAFLIDVYRQSGVTIPIFELPLGRDLTPFLNAPLKEKRTTPFTFGCLAAGFSRKNYLLLISAFHKAFQNRNDVRLLINCRICAPVLRAQILDVLKRLNATNIVFTEDCLDTQSYFERFSSIDCYISISKGEGFSIQPREAMAMGIPTIVSDNTAQHTICQSNLVKSIHTTLR